MPQVSVIIPNYNHARFLDRRIHSVLDQTYQDFEVIILDDASTDDSLEVIRKYAGDSRVTVYPNEANSDSVFKQWNKGVRLAKGEYIWIAESDDDAEPQLLETLVGKMEADPEVVLAYCQSRLIDSNGVRFGTDEAWCGDLAPGRWKADFINDGRDECARFLFLKTTVVNASAVVFRRASYLEAGAASEGMRLCGDWMMWVHLSLLGRISYTASPLNFFRCHNSSVRARTGLTRFCEEAVEIRSFICSQLSLPASIRKIGFRDTLGMWSRAVRHDSPAPDLTTAFRIAELLSHLGHGSLVWVVFIYFRDRLYRIKLGALMLPLYRKLRRAWRLSHNLSKT